MFRTNELFIKRYEEIIEWLLSTKQNHKYPDHAKNNQYGFRRHASKYKYDESESNLYRKMRFSDGISECKIPK